MIADILRHTPPWVFLVLVLLIGLGLRRLRTRDIHPRQLLVLPAAMAALSASGLWQAFGSNGLAVAAWVLCIGLSLGIGWILPPQTGVQYSPASDRVRVPGSAVPLILMMTIFLMRYGVAVSLAIDPSLRLQPAFVIAVGAAFGLTSGCFGARALRTWKSAFPRRSEAVAGGVVS